MVPALPDVAAGVVRASLPYVTCSFGSGLALSPARPLGFADGLIPVPLGRFQGGGSFAADRELWQMRTRAEQADEVTHELSRPTTLKAQLTQHST
jgi:hypothetical protein